MSLGWRPVGLSGTARLSGQREHRCDDERAGGGCCQGGCQARRRHACLRRGRRCVCGRWPVCPTSAGPHFNSRGARCSRAGTDCDVSGERTDRSGLPRRVCESPHRLDRLTGLLRRCSRNKSAENLAGCLFRHELQLRSRASTALRQVGCVLPLAPRRLCGTTDTSSMGRPQAISQSRTYGRPGRAAGGRCTPARVLT